MAEIVFEGPCPFLTCLITERHSHPVCPECGAVNYSSLACSTCTGEEGQTYRTKYYKQYLVEVQRMARRG
jgi:hypothetical protein